MYRGGRRAPVRVRQPTHQCNDTISVIQSQAFDPSLVTLAACAFGPDRVDLSMQAPDATVSGTHSWDNANPEPDNHAVLRVQTKVDGQVVPMTIQVDNDFKRQVDPTTYEVLVPDGAVHTVDFTTPVGDLPMGENMPVTVEPLSIQNMTRDEFLAG